MISLPSRHILLLIAASLPAVALAQQPGRGATAPRTEALAAFPPALASLMTLAQRSAIDAVTQETAPLATTAANARQALATASVASPRNDADISAKAAALASAEQALATARAEKFAALQAGPNRLPDSLRTGAIARLNGAGGGRGGGLLAEDTKGFVSIFDGKTLTGWDGDPKFWRAEGGSIVGESTPENPVQLNTFLIWRGAKVNNFELKAEFRINGTNSGIQYRSQVVPEAGRWVLSGYQADMDYANNYPGQLGEERGRRNIMVTRGQLVRAEENDVFKFVATLGDPSEIGNSFIPNGWNSYHIIARGDVLIHILNGRVSAIMLDDDVMKRAMGGVIGLQMHVGQPFKVEYRNLLYRAL